MHFDFERQRDVGGDDLHPFITHPRDPRAQAFVPLDERREAALQGRNVQPAAQAQGGRNVVGGTLRLQLPEEPLPLLGIGQRQVVHLLASLRDRQAGEAHALGLDTLIEQFLLRQRQANEAGHEVQVWIGKHGSDRL